MCPRACSFRHPLSINKVLQHSMACHFCAEIYDRRTRSLFIAVRKTKFHRVRLDNIYILLRTLRCINHDWKREVRFKWVIWFRTTWCMLRIIESHGKSLFLFAQELCTDKTLTDRFLNRFLILISRTRCVERTRRD